MEMNRWQANNKRIQRFLATTAVTIDKIAEASSELILVFDAELQRSDLQQYMYGRVHCSATRQPLVITPKLTDFFQIK